MKRAILAFATLAALATPALAASADGRIFKDRDEANRVCNSESTMAHRGYIVSAYYDSSFKFVGWQCRFTSRR